MAKAKPVTAKANKAARQVRPAPAGAKDWAVVIYMVADGPSGNLTLDQVASRDLLAILDAAMPQEKDDEKKRGDVGAPVKKSKPIDRMSLAIQVDLSDQDGIFRWALG